jgi:DNA (cytosine-5)-methyltransferase 1
MPNKNLFTSIEVIDLFCGAGGSTSGIENAVFNGEKIARVIACINHDPIAIQSHAANHKETIHFNEDIRTFDVNHLPSFSENAISCLWASLECTNFSNAKGGKPRDRDSRTLANELFRYLKHLSPDYLLIENVREFRMWGDLDENGKPVSKDKGRLYLQWVKKVKALGYVFQEKLLNAADYGAHTSRIRLFLIFAKPGMPIIYPEPTHTKKTDMSGLKKWKPVKECLDFQDKGSSIFRDKPLSENTYKRIYAGLVKFIANGSEAYLTKWMGNNAITGINNGNSINDPAITITTQNRIGLIQPAFLAKYYSSCNNTDVNKGSSIDDPAATLTCRVGMSLIQPNYLIKYYGTGENIISPEEVCATLTTKDRMGIVSSHFLDLQFGQGKQNQSIESPAGAITTVPKLNIVNTEFLISYLKSNPRNIEDSHYTITTENQSALVNLNIQPWIMDTSFRNTGNVIDEPARTILANRKYHYLMNPQYASKGSSVDNPAFTLIARMDKRPPYLISMESGDLAIEIYASDSEFVKRIKLFMAAYGIIDISMRMLKVPELLKIQGFDDDYILLGSQADKKKFIGNAVVPIVAQRMVEALYMVITAEQKKERA